MTPATTTTTPSPWDSRPVGDPAFVFVVRIERDVGGPLISLNVLTGHRSASGRAGQAIYWAIMSSGADPIATVRLLRARGADPTRATMKSYFGPKSPLDTVKEIGNDPAMRAEFADLLYE